MPVKPKPYKVRCNECGWSKRCFPRSDMLIPGVDYWDECPKCGSQKLEQTELNSFNPFGSWLK